MPPLRLVFLGSDAIAVPLLEWLAGEGRGAATLVAAFTQPDRAAGRGLAVQPNAIKSWALGRGLPVFQPAKPGAADAAQLEALEPDTALVMAYGHILSEEFLSIPRLGTLNLHASLLPRYRGASPIQTAVASGERETGASLMRIVRRLDAERERVAIEPLDTAAQIEAKLAAACVPLFARTLPRLAEGVLDFEEQDGAGATYCRRLAKEDGVLDFHAPAGTLAARINGLYPWPACSVELAGARVKIGLADAIAERGPRDLTTPGTVLGSDEQGLVIAASAGLLRLRRLQRAGGRMLPAAEFLRGFAVPPGAVIESRRMPELVRPTPFRQ